MLAKTLWNRESYAQLLILQLLTVSCDFHILMVEAVEIWGNDLHERLLIRLEREKLGRILAIGAEFSVCAQMHLNW